MASPFTILSPWIDGGPTDAQILVKFKVTFDFTIPASLSGTKTIVTVNPTAPAVYNVNKNGASIGTVSIAVNGTVTLGGAGATFLASNNDIFSLTAPTPVDITLAGVSIAVNATR